MRAERIERRPCALEHRLNVKKKRYVRYKNMGMSAHACTTQKKQEHTEAGTHLKRWRCGNVTLMPPMSTMALWKPTMRRLAPSLRGSITASSCTVVVNPLQPLYTARFVNVLEQDIPRVWRERTAAAGHENKNAARAIEATSGRHQERGNRL